jgi:hypothetical protein
MITCIISNDASTSMHPFSDMSLPRVFFDVYADSTSLGRIVFELFDSECPKTCENFRALCTMEKGYGYKASIMHRVVRGYFLQGAYLRMIINELSSIFVDYFRRRFHFVCICLSCACVLS